MPRPMAPAPTMPTFAKTGFTFNTCSTKNLYRARIDNVGWRAFDEVDHIVKGGAKVQLIIVLLDVADVRSTNAILQPQQRVALQNGFGLEDVDCRHAGPSPVEGADQGVGLNQFGARGVHQQGAGFHACQIIEPDNAPGF